MGDRFAHPAGSGVFALEIHTFREYFMGFGGAA